MPKLCVKCAKVVPKLLQTVPSLCIMSVRSHFFLCINAQKLCVSAKNESCSWIRAMLARVTVVYTSSLRYFYETFVNFYLLERLAFSFSFNYELVPVYTAFHTQLGLHIWFNHTL